MAKTLSSGGRTLAELLALADEIAPVIEEQAPESEAQRCWTETAFQALLNGGLYRLLLPRSVGGSEVLPSGFSQVLERIARADGSAAWCLGQTGGCSMSAALLAPEVAREIFEDPRAVLAWGVGPAGQAVAVEGGYRVSGTWPFSSGGRQANWMGAHVPVCGPDGAPRKNDDGSPLVRTVLFPAHEAKWTDLWHVMGLKATGSDSYSVDGLFVPHERSFVRDAAPHASQDGVTFRFPIVLVYAAGFAGVALGIARGMLEAFIDLAKHKVPQKLTVALRDSPIMQLQVAQAEAKLESSRMYLWRSLEEIEAELLASGRGSLTAAQRMRVRLASTHGIHQAKEVGDSAFRAAGSTAIFQNGPFERRFRDLHAVTQQIQARYSQFELVGQYLLGVTDDPGNY